jgi:hypothetical protein
MRPQLESAADLESLCFNQVAEGLLLEFKEKEDASTGVLSKNDQKSIAEVVSAFANSDGGTLIFGIKSQRRGSIDVASELAPIANIEQFADAFAQVCSLNVGPQIPDIDIRIVKLAEKKHAGFLVCEVSRSDRRPHMSTAPNVHRYYRRSFEGTVPMTPSEIRDQILAVRDAILEPIVTYPAGGSFSPSRHWISAHISFVFSLKNVGRSVCRNPFLRVHADADLYSHSATYDSALAAWKTMFPDGTLIHVDDQQSCLSLSLNACVLTDRLSAHFHNQSHDLTDAVMIFPGSQNHNVSTITDKTSLDGVELHLRYGAENAPVTERTVPFSRLELARGLLGQSSIREMHTQNWGAWVQSLVDEYQRS